MHSISDCPLRSTAIIKVNQKNIITFASKEMLRLLSCEQLVHQNLMDIWIQQPPTQQQQQQQQQSLVTLIKNNHTLCICTHKDGDAKIIVCTDISELDQLYQQQQNIDRLMISRLTMYGTIDALFQPYHHQNQSLQMSIGQPMMRYIHSDDVQTFCAGLNEATKLSTISTFHVRLLAPTEEIWSEFKVMSIEEGNRILCLMTPYHPQNDTSQLVIQTTHCYVEKTVTQLQQKFWYALEQGMTLIARNLATVLILVVQTLWSLWHDDTKSSLAHLLSSSSEYLFRRAVEATKERPEINQLCRMISWVGISPTTSKAFIDDTLDHTTEWLISKATMKHPIYCDILV